MASRAQYPGECPIMPPHRRDTREARRGWKCPRGYVDDVAAVIAQVVLDDRAAGRVYNVADPVAFTEAEWVARIGEAVGWEGEVLAAPAGRIPLPFHCEQGLDTDPSRLRHELGGVGGADGM